MEVFFMVFFETTRIFQRKFDKNESRTAGLEYLQTKLLDSLL